MSYRFRVPLDPAAGMWLLVVCGLVAVGMIVGAVLQGKDAQVVIDVGPAAVATATPGATPEAAVAPDVGRVVAQGSPGAPLVYPPLESVIRHYFGPLGEADEAVGVWLCESGPGAARVGAHGEVGPLQILPDGAGRRFVEEGWDLLDERENVIAAALIVASEGWGPWEACLGG